MGRDEGLPGLFRGVSSKCSETGSKNFVFFFIYDGVNRKAKQYTRITSSVSLLLGYVSGLGTTILTMPLEVISTRQQAVTGNQGGGMFAVVGDILNNEGIGGLFKGFWFNVLLCINPAIQNTCFDRIKEVVLKRKSLGDPKKRVSMTPLEAFVLGALAKAVATVVTFPLVRLKTMLQAGREIKPHQDHEQDEADGDALMKRPSAAVLVRRLSLRSDLEARVQGQFQRFCELYRGMGPALLKGVLQAAVLYATKDQVAKVVTILLKTSAHMFRGGKHQRHKFRALSGRPLAS